MGAKRPESLILSYLYLAIGCGVLGVIITFLLILACAYLGIDIYQHLWLLAIPVTTAVILNILFIELYRKFRKY